MFLNLNRLFPQRDERGSTMLAVLGLALVTSVIGVTVVTATINGLGVTSSTRAGVQARAAAEAGVDRALVAIQSGCVTTFESTTVPRYKYELKHSINSVNPIWVTGCPTNAATLIKITATGYAANTTVTGASPSDSRTVEAVYANVPIYVPAPAIQPAVYAYTMEGVFRNFVLNSSSASIAADVQIKNGNVVCENGATIDGSVLLANGYIELNRCDVNGAIHVSKYVDIGGTGTVVKKDVIALGQGVAAGSDVVKLRSGIGEVRGSVNSAGNVQIDDLVQGSVSLPGTSSNSVKVGSGGRVQGNVVSSGTVAVTGSGAIDGTTSTNFTGLAPLPIPRVPDWTDIPYPHPTAWNGYTVLTWPSTSSCNIGNSNAFWDSLNAQSASLGNIVVDARSCGAAGLDFQNNIRNIQLSANITFIAWKFNVDKLVATTNSSATRYLWFMVPDNYTTPAGQPTCPAVVNPATPVGTITLTNEADIAPTIAAMAYTPCKIISDRNNWRGQLYGGTMEFRQQAQLTYVPVGVTGVNFDASLPPILVLTSSKLGGRVSFRELS
ncbi:cytoskeletal protein CcmA (bactofilin family) [Marisediminicola sp. UYEF4]|uniref:hypothetical protein n=1 Tax=Marisediminicola sp. UYEF4 TaxID=1756384 RepID=UPI0033962417